jgi:CHAD domain-containing protein
MPLDIDRIQKSVRRVRKFLARAPKNPTPEKIHDLRTSARRLEATVEALGLDSKRREKRLLRDLAQEKEGGQGEGHGRLHRAPLGPAADGKRD